jgi:hypothetical protein
MAAKVGGEGQQAAYKKLNADPPSGWYTGPPWYGERPNVWRTPILEASRGPAALGGHRARRSDIVVSADRTR